MEANQHLKVAVFFCRQLDPDQDANRRLLEKELGPRVRFFPLPCSGRIDPLHFLKALETGSDKVFLIACPEGACRYGQGNLRAAKRLGYARGLVAEVGFSPDSLELVHAVGPLPLSIDTLSRQILGLAQSGSPALFKAPGSPTVLKAPGSPTILKAPGSPAVPENKGETVAKRQ